MESKNLETLERQLSETLAAEQFFELNSGRLIIDLLSKEINLAITDITSDKYEKDHMGYLKRLSDLQANKRLLNKLRLAASPQRKSKIKEKLDGLSTE